MDSALQNLYENVAAQHVAGRSLRQIGEATGRSRDAVLRLLKKDEVRVIVDRMREEKEKHNLSNSPEAIALLLTVDVINSMKRACDEIDDKKKLAEASFSQAYQSNEIGLQVSALNTWGNLQRTRIQTFKEMYDILSKDTARPIGGTTEVKVVTLEVSLP